MSAPLLLTVPNGLDPRHAALTEPMAVGLHAVNKSAIQPGEAALVIGCGPIGIAIIAALRHRGVEHIVAADFSQARRDLPRRWAHTRRIDPAQGSPFDTVQPAVVFEAVGVPGIINDVLRRAPTGSRLVVAGVCMEPDTVLPFFATAKEINVQFVFAYDPAEFAESLRAIAEGEIDVGPADHRRGRARRGRRGVRRAGQTRHTLQDPGDALTVGCQACRSQRERNADRLLVLAAAGLTVRRNCRPATLRRDRRRHRSAEARQVTVVGAGEVQGTPDTLTVNASIEFIAPDVTGAMNQTSDRQNGRHRRAGGRGHRPQGHQHQPGEPAAAVHAAATAPTIIGYRASNSIDVKIRQLDAASQALALIVSTGGDATRINNVNYSIEDDSQLVRDARAGPSTTPRTAPSSTRSCPGWTSAR